MSVELSEQKIKIYICKGFLMFNNNGISAVQITLSRLEALLEGETCATATAMDQENIHLCACNM